MNVTTYRARLASLAAAAILVAVSATAFPARAQTTSLDQARQQAARVKSSYERIAQEYADQNARLGRTEEGMALTRREIARGLAKKAALEAQLRKRIRAAYQMGGLGFFEVLLDARSFQDFTVRYMTLQRQSLSDEGVILQLRRQRAELEAKQQQLKEERLVQSRQAAKLRAQARELTISFDQAQELVKDLAGKLKAEQIAQLFKMGGDVSGTRIPLDFCPVQGPHYVNDDFGAPRGGGTRRHQGNDIMAPMGTPIVAPTAGTITLLQSGGNGGLAIFMTGLGNVAFYFAHESEISVRQGQEVSAGQEIGRVGDTGNAVGGAPHLHFEIHPGRGAAIDPHASLAAVC